MSPVHQDRCQDEGGAAPGPAPPAGGDVGSAQTRWPVPLCNPCASNSARPDHPRAAWTSSSCISDRQEIPLGSLASGWGAQPFLTNEPQPCTISIRPSSTRMASARRAVFLATPYSCMSVVIEGSRAPGGRSPLVILPLSSSAIWRLGGTALS